MVQYIERVWLASDKLCESKEILQKLWDWRDLSPSTNNKYVVDNLQARRIGQGTNYRHARDIITFLTIEGANLNIKFLTENCENIPGCVHETEALRDVYTLLNKNQQEYLAIKDDLREKSFTLDIYSKMVLSFRDQVTNEFNVIKGLLNQRQTTEESNNVRLPTPDIANTTVNNESIRETESESTTASSDTTEISADVVAVEENEEEVFHDVNEDNEITSVTDNQNNNGLEDITLVEEGEIDTTLVHDGQDENSYARRVLIGTVPAPDNRMGVMEHSHSTPLLPIQNRTGDVRGLHTSPIAAERAPSPLNTDNRARGRRTSSAPPPPASHNRLGARGGSQTTPPLSTHRVADNREQNPERMRRFNPFLMKRKKRNLIQDEGNEPIPFSAIRETNEYKAFVTHIHPDTDMNLIKRHISAKLGTNVTLTPLSKQGASVLSFAVYCRSERDDLDLKMPGLWPLDTLVYKWRSNGQNRRFVQS